MVMTDCNDVVIYSVIGWNNDLFTVRVGIKSDNAHKQGDETLRLGQGHR